MASDLGGTALRTARVGSAAVAVLACLVVLAAPARAATVEVGYRVQMGAGETFTRYVLVLQARTGERNDLIATLEPSGAYLIEERGANLEARDRCSQLAPRRVRCAPPIDEVELPVGDGDDRVDATRAGPLLTASGGPGADALFASNAGSDLYGGAGDDSLAGGSGLDELHGAGGRDTLTGKGGNDALHDDDELGGAGPSPDVFEGGPGRDFVSYQLRSSPVTVDLTRAAGHGAAGENDRFNSIENVLGGSASDRLSGTDGTNQLDGGGGRDVLRGRGGPDKLLNGYVDYGGAGNDVFDNTHRRVFCGPGRDSVFRAAAPSRRTLVAPDCERITADVEPELLIRPRLPLRSLRAPVAHFLARCDRRRGSCRAVVRLRGSRSPSRFRRGRRALLASRAVRIRRRGRVRATVRLSPRGRRALRRARRLYVRIEVVLIGAAFSVYDRQSDSFVMRLRAP